MSFTENLKVEIESIFNSKGFEQLDRRLSSAKAKIQGMQQLFREAEGINEMRNQTGELQSKIDQTALSFERVDDATSKLSQKQLAAGFGGRDLAEAPEAAKRQIDELGGVIKNSRGEVISLGRALQRISNRMRAPGQGLNVRGQMRSPDEIVQSGGFDPQQFRLPRAGDTGNLDRALLSMGVMNEELSAMGDNITRANRISTFTNKVKNAGGAIRQMTPSIRSLQMRLLGLQFTMLTVAFIFGGMMASALGAVGVFKVLGNTLKFLFLPTALNVLDGVLDLQEAVFNLDEGTREAIGNFMFWTSVLAIAIGLLAALGKAALSVAGFFSTVGGALSTLIGFFGTGSSAGSSLLAVLSGIGSGGVLGGIASLIPPLAALIGALIAAFTIYQRFPTVVNAVASAFKFLGNVIMTWGQMTLKQLTTIFGGMVNVIQGAVTLIVALLLGQFDKAFRGLAELGQGLFSMFVQPLINTFEFLANVLVGNSIVPDMVKSIINWFLSIPRMIAGLGSSIVDTIAQGIKNAGRQIWNSFKKILPDFLVDAIEKGGGALKGVVKAGGDIVGAGGNVIGQVGDDLSELGSDIKEGAGDAWNSVTQSANKVKSDIGNSVNDFTTGFSRFANDMISGGGSNQQSQKNVQNVQVNADVNVQDRNESPLETGTKFGQGMANGLNNQTSNVSGGT